MTGVWCARLLTGGGVLHGVRISADAAGRITALTADTAVAPGDLELGTVLPGMGDAHSHAFHRVLRGRTHDDGGDFWSWRRHMYAAAHVLDPDTYRELATAVYRELADAGWTAVGEFHYVHHRPDGTAYPDAHAMEEALHDAAEAAGIRLVLLDTLYLAGGIGRPLAAEQLRFGDGSADRWLTRWHDLADRVAARGPLVTLGAAVHSVRAVPPEQLRIAVEGLPAGVPLHAHVSEQPLENTEALSAYGATPVRLLAGAGALSDRFAAVHATHLSDDDVALLAGADVSVVLCPTTEADLGDGIGPAERLAAAGVRLSLGSDQHAVVDPFLELQAVESGARLASGRRGVFTPQALLAMAGRGGYEALGLPGGLGVGAPADLVEIDAGSVRTAGAAPAQLPLVATAADVRRVVVGGRLRPARDTAGALSAAIARIDARMRAEPCRGGAA